MQRHNSEPEMTSLICSRLASWGNRLPLHSFQTQNHEMKLVSDEQVGLDGNRLLMDSKQPDSELYKKNISKVIYTKKCTETES